MIAMIILRPQELGYRRPTIDYIGTRDSVDYHDSNISIISG